LHRRRHAEQAEAYAVADFAEVNARFVESFRMRFPTFGRGTIVDLGCGPADIAIRLARTLTDHSGAKRYAWTASRGAALYGSGSPHHTVRR
jgi:hypothetical protein